MSKIFLRDTNNYRYWIILALIAKTLFFAFMFFQNGADIEKGGIYLEGGDTPTYLEPIEKLISGGTYFPAHRMPGYGAVYFIFRQLFSQTASQNLLIIMQLILSGISVYVLALTAMYIFDSKALFYGTFYTYLLSTYTSVFDIYLLTDSFSVSALIFAVFWFAKGVKNFDYKAFVLSGLFLTWCIFLKCVSVPIFGVFIVILAINYIRHPGRKHLNFNLGKGMVLLLLFLMLFDGLWIARNYRVYGKIIPVQIEYGDPKIEKDEVFNGLRYFLGAWGGDHTWWNPKAEICWFGYPKAGERIERQIKDIKFPRYIYTSKFNYEDLVAVKNYIALSENQAIPKNERLRLRQLTASRLREYGDSIKREKPYIYYIYAPLRTLKTFLIHSGTYNLFNKVAAKLNIFELGFKLIMSALYLFVVIAGFLGAIYIFFKNGIFNIKSVVAIIAVYFTLIFPFAFRKCEYRYFVQAYPFMLVCAIYLITSIYRLIAEENVKRKM